MILLAIDFGPFFCVNRMFIFILNVECIFINIKLGYLFMIGYKAPSLLRFLSLKNTKGPLYHSIELIESFLYI